jgi:hypothetical protein
MTDTGWVLAGLRAVLSGPRRWIGPVVLVCVVGITVGAAPAAADSSSPGVLINGARAANSPSGSTNEYCDAAGVCVGVAWQQGTDSSGMPAEQVLIGSVTPGSQVTGALMKIPFPNWTASGPCGEVAKSVLGCFASRGQQVRTMNSLIRCLCAADGTSARAAAQPCCVENIDVSVNYKPISACDFPGGAARDFGDPVATVADACTPPSHTRITDAQIKTNTAFFRFTGRLATHFQCVLFRGNQRTFNHSCGSGKPFAKRLPRGHYTFEVFGVNRAGFDPKPATKSFDVK